MKKILKKLKDKVRFKMKYEDISRFLLKAEYTNKNTIWKEEDEEGNGKVSSVSSEGSFISKVALGAPEKNEDFTEFNNKKKNIELVYRDSVIDKGKFQLFFALKGKGNPGDNVPNWYYYWGEKGNVVPALNDIKYVENLDDPDGRGAYNKRTGEISLVNAAVDSFDGYDKTFNEPILKPILDVKLSVDIETSNKPKGLKALCLIIAHEEVHEEVHDQNTGNDVDYDGIDNSHENRYDNVNSNKYLGVYTIGDERLTKEMSIEGYEWDPYYNQIVSESYMTRDTYNIYGFFGSDYREVGDNELRARVNEESDGNDIYDACNKKKDWSKGGKNWK